MGFKTHFIKIFSIILILSLLFASPALAITAQELAQKLRNFIDNAIRVGAVLAFLGIVWGGFLYIKSAGNVAQMSQAKKQIFGSFLGLFLLLTGWLGLRIIRVEFTALNPENIPQIIETSKPLTQPVGLYLPSVEIPIETFLKGKDEDKSFLFEFTSTTAEIQKTFEEELLPAVNEVKKGVDEIVGLMSQCSCAILNCPAGCQGDPCALVRGLMSQKIHENAQRIEEVNKIVNSPELERKIISLLEPVAKLYYALGQIRKCPEYLAYSRDSFPQLKDWFQKNMPELESVVTRVSLLEEPENLRKWSFADFYCPKGGLGSFIPEEREIEKFREEIEKQLEKAKQKPEEQEEFERMEKEMEEMLKKLSPEYEFALSCPLSIPFGESLEKLLKVLVETINKIREMVKLAKEMNAQLVKIESLISECSSERCYPFEVCIPGTEPPVCFCLCLGIPCPMGKAWVDQFWFNFVLYKNFQQNFQELKDLKKEAESWTKDWEKIEKEVRKRETPLTPEEIEKLYQKFPNSKEIVSFELTLARMHYCFAQPKEVEAQWSLANCNTALGSLSPDNKILEKEEECKCETVKECQKNFPVLVPYKCKYLFKESVTGETPDWLLDLWENIRKILKIGEIKECYNFNFFCCRQK